MTSGRPRVVGFFPSNTTAGYAVFQSMARKLQGMISFGECFDAPIQKKFMGARARKSVVQVVKADKRERKLTYDGPLVVPRMARWVATHSLALVQDLQAGVTQAYIACVKSAPGGLLLFSRWSCV